MSAASDDLPGNVPLSGVIGSVDSTVFTSSKSVSKYNSAFVTTMQLMGNIDVSVKHTTFKVGVANDRCDIARPAELYRTDTSMDTSSVIQQQLREMGSRTSALPATWNRMDLFGVAMRAAMGMAHYSVWGDLTPYELRGGGAVAIHSIAAVVGPIAADPGAVFVSVKSVHTYSQSLLAAFANCISGEGGTMFTDLLGVDTLGAIMVPTASGAGLAQGCYRVLQILGSIFKACGQGAFFGYAVTCGVHRVKSVHGHSDEGAYFRKIVRRFEAGVPYGAVPVDVAYDMAIPNPGASLGGFRTVVDSVLLATAGLVALSDPMVSKDGRLYPTILASTEGALETPDTNNAGSDADSRCLTTQWAEAVPQFAALYARGLSQLFLSQGGSFEVVRLMCAQAASLAGTVDRHMKHKVVVAFMFIEPTGSCPIGDDSFPAYTERHGPLATVDKPRVIRSFDGVAAIEERSTGGCYALQVAWGYARRHGLVIHLSSHRLNGLSNIALFSGVVTDFALIGGANPLGPRIMSGSAGLNTVMWGRGDSAIVAPGELIYAGRSLALVVDMHAAPQHGYYGLNHVPTRDEAMYGVVHCSVTRLSGLAPSPPGDAPGRAIRRARCAASNSLCMAALGQRQRAVHIRQALTPSLTDYGDVPTGGPVQIERLLTDAEAAGNGTTDAADHALGANARAMPEAPTPGMAALVRIEQRRDYGPRAPRSGAMGGNTSNPVLPGRGKPGRGGGGGNPPAPPGPRPPPPDDGGDPGGGGSGVGDPALVGHSGHDPEVGGGLSLAQAHALVRHVNFVAPSAIGGEAISAAPDADGGMVGTFGGSMPDRM